MPRKLTRFAALFLIFAYLPILVGGGECVALCFGGDGTVDLDYTHTCGRAEGPAIHAHGPGDAAVIGWRDAHFEIHIFSGNASLTMPGSVHATVLPAAGGFILPEAVEPFRSLHDVTSAGFLLKIPLPSVSPSHTVVLII